MGSYVNGDGWAGAGRSPRADHRLDIYRAADGDLMCLARAGALSSETRISVSLCGAEIGCRGVWRCLQTSDTTSVSKS